MLLGFSITEIQGKVLKMVKKDPLVFENKDPGLLLGLSAKSRVREQES